MDNGFQDSKRGEPVVEYFFSVNEAARRLGVHRSLIYRLMAERKIEFVQVSEKRRVISQRALDEFMRARTVPVAVQDQFL